MRREVYVKTLRLIKHWNRNLNDKEWRDIRPKLEKILEYALSKDGTYDIKGLYDQLGNLEEDKLAAIKLKRRLWEF